jgi:hypothetical protein
VRSIFHVRPKEKHFSEKSDYLIYLFIFCVTMFIIFFLYFFSRFIDICKFVLLRNRGKIHDFSSCFCSYFCCIVCVMNSILSFFGGGRCWMFRWEFLERWLECAALFQVSSDAGNFVEFCVEFFDICIIQFISRVFMDFQIFMIFVSSNLYHEFLWIFKFS